VPLLCEPFYRAGASRTAGSRAGAVTGVGLGLSIVSSINQAHDGDLEITAREGGGLAVRWRFARIAKQLAERAINWSAGIDAGTASARHPVERAASSAWAARR
jgi:hypothetical protein